MYRNSTHQINNPSRLTPKSDEALELQQALLNLTQPNVVDLRQSLEFVHAELEASEDRRSADKQSTDDKLQHIEMELTTIRAQLDEAQKLLTKLSPILPDTIQQANAHNHAGMVDAISPLIVPTIQKEVVESKDMMAAALAPVIGKAVAKAVRNAMDNLTQRVDAQTKSPLNAIGRLFGRSREEEIRNNLPYAVRHIFLIDSRSGILVAALDDAAEEITDADLISGMLTAIRSFVRDSFEGTDSELDAIKYGENRILIEHGEFVYLAAEVEGIEPADYRAQMNEIVQGINIENEDALETFNGDVLSLPDFSLTLAPLLRASS